MQDNGTISAPRRGATVWFPRRGGGRLACIPMPPLRHAHKGTESSESDAGLQRSLSQWSSCLIHGLGLISPHVLGTICFCLFCVLRRPVYKACALRPKGLSLPAFMVNSLHPSLSPSASLSLSVTLSVLVLLQAEQPSLSLGKLQMRWERRCFFVSHSNPFTKLPIIFSLNNKGWQYSVNDFL